MKKARLLPRKKPLQKRSTQLVDDILRGAIRVLKKQGGRRFTTIRVAEEAGISVGSLYQYFPNKESILFQVQQQEWQATSGMLLKMIADARFAPPKRLGRAIEAFFETERMEADLRKALAETGISLEQTEEFQRLRAVIFTQMAQFLAQLRPALSASKRRFLAEFIFTVMGSLAEEVTTRIHSQSEVKKWAAHCADMILSFVG